MTQYILRRFLHSVFVVWGCATLVFLLMRAIPGDPIIQMLGQEYTPQAATNLRHKYGLDQPLYVQYVKWMGNALQGDFGNSIATRESVSKMIAGALPKTMSITLVSFVIAVLIALPAGIISALKKNTALDYISGIVAFIGVSMPGFWFGIILILIFAVKFQMLPALGYASPGQDGIVEWFKHIILPSLAIGMGYAAILTRFVRSGLLEVLGQDYIRTARAKGLYERAVIARHALRNALIPVITVAGIQLAALLSGAVVTETVFSIRGLGRILVGAIFDKDYPVVQGVILLVAVIFITANFVVDMLYAYLDPRIRYV